MKTKFNLKSILMTALVSTSLFTNAQVDKVPLTVAVAMTNPTCQNYNNGEITLTISGGFPPYTFNGVEIAGSQVTMGALTAGNYSIQVSDVSLASSSGEVILQSPQAPQISAIIGDVTEFGGNDGYIDLMVNSQYNVSYSWTTQEQIQIAASSEDQTGLVAGIYDVTITESNGCQYAKRYTIQQNDQLFSPNMDFATQESNENEISEITVFPNPSFGEVTIKTGDKIAEYAVVNEMGTTVAQGKGSFANETLNLTTGKYYIISTDINGNTTRKYLQIL